MQVAGIPMNLQDYSHVRPSQDSMAPLLPRHRMLQGNPGFWCRQKRCNNKGGKMSDQEKRIKGTLKTNPARTHGIFIYMNG